MLIVTKNLTLDYPDGDKIVRAVDSVNLQLPEKGLFGVLGPSGSGKTSLLYLLSGLRTPTSGRFGLMAGRCRFLRSKEINFDVIK